MKYQSVRIEVRPLCLKLKVTFRHASASRKRGESLWVKAERKGVAGFGEGCPRVYAAGDDLDSSLRWVEDLFCSGPVAFNEFKDLIEWARENSDLIDQYPSAWCAVEAALLDLFSKEEQTSVEELLGMDCFQRKGTYSAILGDGGESEFRTLAQKYLALGFSDFKVKINGSLERDQSRSDLLHDLCRKHRMEDARVRLDANNLWADDPEGAIEYLKALSHRAFAIEEPVGARHTNHMSSLSTATGLPVILDESLCTVQDLSDYKGLPGKFIANIKVSRVGGIVRALQMVREARKLGFPVIVGCHVGETSLLTRAALIPASAAGENLLAQEGAFGEYLVEQEPVEPALMFGREGILDLDRPYRVETSKGKETIPVENWDYGFGLRCFWKDGLGAQDPY